MSFSKALKARQIRVDAASVAAAASMSQECARLYSILLSSTSAEDAAKKVHEFYPSLEDALGAILERLTVASWGWAEDVWRTVVKFEASKESRARPMLEKPNRKKIEEIVNRPTRDGLNWRNRLRQWSTIIASENKLRRKIINVLSQGGTPDDLARAIRPMVAKVESTARRIARTESLRVANETQVDTYKQMSGDIRGYTRVAVLDDVTRPEHRALDGMRYGVNKEDGAPPYDLPDAPNCRCYWEPIFSWDS